MKVTFTKPEFSLLLLGVVIALRRINYHCGWIIVSHFNVNYISFILTVIGSRFNNDYKENNRS